MGRGDARARVRRILEHTGTLPARVRSDILALGHEAVAPLLELLRDESLAETGAPGGGYALVHAAELLVALQAPEAITPLVRWLMRTMPGEVLHGALLLSLEELGPAVVPAALETLAEARTPDERLGLLSVLARSGARDERIHVALLELLQEDPGQGALALARYGDPRDVEPLKRALDACPLDEEVVDLFANQALIELGRAIAKLGGTLDAAQREKVERARQSRKWLGGLLMQMLDVLPPLPEGLEPRRPWPDDPCWCGSGLKYEECHLGRDIG